MAILAVESPTIQPAMRIISDLSNGNPATVTTTFAHDYVTGTIVRLFLPSGYGMDQANQQQGTITVTSTTQFTIDIDTTLFEAFTTPVDFPETQQYPQVVPIGEINSILSAAAENVLPYSAS